MEKAMSRGLLKVTSEPRAERHHERVRYANKWRTHALDRVSSKCKERQENQESWGGWKYSEAARQ